MADVQELENAIDIVDLVQRYIKIKKAGVNYKSNCPFPGHTEKTPSFMVSPAKQLAYCFGCHKWGWALKFIMDVESCEFREALEILWWITGIKVWNSDPAKVKQNKNLYHIYKDARTYYKSALKKYPEVKKYLLDRGMSEDLIEKFDFGYSDSWVELYNYLKWQWYDDKIIGDSAIFNSVSSKKDKFINRIIFPIQNARWDFVAFAGRIIGVWEPKYLNSPATSIYDKSWILYGLFKARTTITKEDFVIITEWYMDTISLHEAGFTNAVAVSWTALTEKHIKILKRLTHKIYLCFDWDKAWEKATKLSIENLKNNDLEIRIIMLPEWGDPDDYIKSGWDFKDLINWALSPIWFLIEKADFDVNSIDEKRKFLAEILQILKSYNSIIEKDFYLKEISKKLNLREETVYEAFNNTRLKRESREEFNIEKQEYNSEDYAIGYILNDSSVLWELKEKIIFTNFISRDLTEVLENGPKIVNTYELQKKERYKALSMKIEANSAEQTGEVVWNILDKLVRKINLDSYKKAITILKEKMNSWDMEAFWEYSEVVKEAKKRGLK
jgi:DNA primase